MKNYIYIALFLFMGPAHLLAQTLNISDTLVVHDGVERPSISVTLAPETKIIKSEIKDWMNDELDVKLKGYGFLTNKDVLIAEKTKIPAISDKQMDVFVKVVEAEENSQMYLFASFGYNIHISPDTYPAAYRAMKGSVLDFLDDFLPAWYGNRLEETQEVVNELQKEHTKLEEEIATNEEEIDALQKENQEYGKVLDQTQKELEDASSTLESRKEKLEKINRRLEKVNKKKDKKSSKN